LQRELTGVAPVKVERTPVVTPYGILPGGYYPLKANPDKGWKAWARLEKENSQDLFETNYVRPQTKQGQLIERVGFAGQEPWLSLGVLHQHLQNVIVDISHRKAIIQVDRLTSNERVRDAIIGTLGKEAYAQIRPWLQRQVNDLRPLTPVEKIIGRARTGVSVVFMGYKVTVATAQLAGLFNSADEVGTVPMTNEIRKFLSSTPREMERMVKFAFENSRELPFRQKNFDREARDATKRGVVGGKSYGEDVKRSYFYAIGLMDLVASVPTWLAAYDQEMKDSGNNHDRAVHRADQAIRMSQGTGAAKDLAAMQAGNELFRMFTNFYSYFSVNWNQFWRRKRGIQKGRITLPKFAASMLLIWWGPALISELLANRGPEEDEEWWKWALAEGLEYPFSTVPGARDIAGYISNRVRGRYSDFKLTPVQSAFEAPAKFVAGSIRDAAEGDLRRSTVRAGFEAVSFWAQLPGRQMWITGEAFYDFLTEQGEVLPQDIFFPRPQERRAR
jgi:hypothetical protein